MNFHPNRKKPLVCLPEDSRSDLYLSSQTNTICSNEYFKSLDTQPDSLLEFLNSKKDDISKGIFFPTKDQILREIPSLSNYKNLNNVVFNWFQKNTRFKSLTELKRHYQGKTLTEKLYEFLDSKERDILDGRFIPSKGEIIRERDEFKDFGEINNRIAKWLKNHTPFSGVKELKDYFLGDPISQQIYDYLDSVKDYILIGRIIPDAKHMAETRPDLAELPHSHIHIYNWIRANTPFNSLSDLREYFEGIPLSRQLWNFLNSKKQEIITGQFIPDSLSIKSRHPEFEGYGTLSSIVGEWLSQNTQFDSITEIKENFAGMSLPIRITNILNSRKEDILKGRFVPTKMNLAQIDNLIEDYSHTNDVINRWLIENTEFKSLSEYKAQFSPIRYELRPITERDRVWKFLDEKKDEIFSGDFFPTIKNIRRIDLDIGNYKYLSRAVADWLNHNSNGRFTKIEDLIDYYDPFPDELGHTGRHGYTAKFENERYRVENAIFQTVQIIDDNDLICLDSEELDFKTWGEFFSFLDKNPQWKLVDILSGEIITKDDIMNERFAFHHNDRDKQQDSRDNLVFVFPHNHGVITLAQMYFPQLADFFEDLINTNINHITDGRIPQSWRTNWRVVALDKGLRLPKDKYRVKTAGNSVLEQNQTGLSKWIKKDSNFTNFCSFDGDFSCRDTF